MKRKANQKSIDPPAHRGLRAQAGGQTLRTYTIGALPLVNQVLERMKLEDFLEQHLPPDRSHQVVPTARCLLLLLRNILLSRLPIYGLGEWAERFAPELLGLSPTDLEHLNDDRVGRALDRLFQADLPELVLGVVRHVIQEFDVSLEELHNDSTTVSFYGAYENAAAEERRGQRTRLAVTFGHSKARRPDLKQLLFILTVTDDGGVPLYFTSASGNVTDDTTHRTTWDLLRQLIGNPDFLYVADCKLATRENLQYLHNQGGRFITILPRTRREDTEFRQQLMENFDAVQWEGVYDVTDEEGEIIDQLRVSAQPCVSSEGFRLLWYHSTRKAERDAHVRARSLERAHQELTVLEGRLRLPKTRFRKREQVDAAVTEILKQTSTERWLRVHIQEVEQETFKQSTRGRPSKETHYVRQVTTRYHLNWSWDELGLERDQATDGVFPLITNQRDMTPAAILRAYRRQPLIEKRFSQFKSDFEVAPVYLKEVTRIQAMLAVYFFALMLQTLLERQLRQALADSEYDSLPLYPEARGCRTPTTPRVIDLFETVQRHQLIGGQTPQTFVTELTPLQQQIANWMGIQPSHYGR